jgi:hypothetical protein
MDFNNRNLGQIIKEQRVIFRASLARGENNANSDIDLMVEMNDLKKYSLFDLLDIAHVLQLKVQRKVDLVEKGQLKELAVASVQPDIIKIYG